MGSQYQPPVDGVVSASRISGSNFDSAVVCPDVRPWSPLLGAITQRRHPRGRRDAERTTAATEQHGRIATTVRIGVPGPDPLAPQNAACDRAPRSTALTDRSAPFRSISHTPWGLGVSRKIGRQACAWPSLTRSPIVGRMFPRTTLLSPGADRKARRGAALCRVVFCRSHVK